MSQTCATCIYGDGTSCHWPYRADNGDHDSVWDAYIEAPQWVHDLIDRKSPHRVNESDCRGCPEFDEREDEDAPKPERCPDTPDMFGGRS
jgi:hypothetical protein